MTIQISEMSVAEAARKLSIGLQYAYTLIYSGRLRARRVAGKWRIRPEAVEERRKQLEARNAGR